MGVERELKKRTNNLERARRKITKGLPSCWRRAQKRDAFEMPRDWQKLVYEAARSVMEKRLPRVEREREKRTKNLERARRKITKGLPSCWKRAQKRDAFKTARAWQKLVYKAARSVLEKRLQRVKRE